MNSPALASHIIAWKFLKSTEALITATRVLPEWNSTFPRDASLRIASYKPSTLLPSVPRNPSSRVSKRTENSWKSAVCSKVYSRSRGLKSLLRSLCEHHVSSSCWSASLSKKYSQMLVINSRSVSSFASATFTPPAARLLVLLPATLSSHPFEPPFDSSPSSKSCLLSLVKNQVLGPYPDPTTLFAMTESRYEADFYYYYEYQRQRLTCRRGTD